MSWSEMILEYTKIFLSPAPVAGALVLLIVILFRDDLRALMSRVATIRFPGGGELSTMQSERMSEAETTEDEAPPTPSEDVSANSLPQSVTLSLEDQEKIKEFIQAERARATLWEYRYLSLYLVPHTQRVLDWFAQVKRTSLKTYDSFWMPLIPEPKERTAILQALRTHHLVQDQGELMEITPKGEEYLRWRGPLPNNQVDS